MMPVLSPMVSKTLQNATAGELVCIPSLDGGHAWAIVATHGRDHTYIVSLGSSEHILPNLTYLGLDPQCPCVSIGTQWIFEPLESGPISRQYMESAGSWVIEDDQIGLRLFAHPRFSDASSTLINLRSMKEMSVHRSHAIGGSDWRLWASQAAKVDARSEPILSHPFSA